MQGDSSSLVTWMRLKAADVLSEWNTESVTARSAAGSAEGSWELCSVIL